VGAEVGETKTSLDNLDSNCLMWGAAYATHLEYDPRFPKANCIEFRLFDLPQSAAEVSAYRRERPRAVLDSCHVDPAWMSNLYATD